MNKEPLVRKIVSDSMKNPLNINVEIMIMKLVALFSISEEDVTKQSEALTQVKQEELAKQEADLVAQLEEVRGKQSQLANSIREEV